jgi:predicted MFS family arabinose efflux permease
VNARRSLARLVGAGDVPEALRPLVAITFAASLAASSGLNYTGIWAIERLHASSVAIGVGFFFTALASSAGGALGGHLSDRRPRRQVAVAAWLAQTVYWLLLLPIGQGHVVWGLTLMVFSGVGVSIGTSAIQAMVADVVPREEQQVGYASLRVAQNLGIALGPPLAAAFVYIGSWPTLFAGASVLSLGALGAIVRRFPARGEHAVDQTSRRRPLAVIRRDRGFVVFLGSTLLAFLVYVAFATVLPISLVGSHGLSPATWGLLAAINPVLVTLLQLRLTRRVEHVPPAAKLAAALLLMGLPLLVLTKTGSVAAAALVIVVFVVGEMLWLPTSQKVVVDFAPGDLRGAYMGAFSSVASVGYALAPFVGLTIRSQLGDPAMWIGFAACSVVAAASGAAATRFHPVEAEDAGATVPPRSGVVRTGHAAGGSRS